MGGHDARAPRNPPAEGPAAPAGVVGRRTVLYLSGFDPQGASRYHGLYRDEASRQAAASGYRIHVGERERSGPWLQSWTVRMHAADGQACDTNYQFLRWDDIVRAHWPRGRLALWAVTLATSWRLWANGSLPRMLRLSWPAFLALALPGLSWLMAAVWLVLGAAAAASWGGSGYATLAVLARAARWRGPGCTGVIATRRPIG